MLKLLITSAGLLGATAALAQEAGNLTQSPPPAPFQQVSEIRWVQDEPSNQGAWSYMALNLPGELAAASPGKDWKLTAVTRPASSAPAVGSAKVHEAQQRELMEAALA